MNKKRVLIYLVISMLAVMAFTACSKNKEPETPTTEEVEETVVEETQVEAGEPVEDEPEEVADNIPTIEYKVDSNYVLVEDCAVREDASETSKQKSYDELSDDAKNHAVEGEDAVLKKGTVVTCLEIKDDWMRIPSGWICCRDSSKLYVDRKITLCDESGKPLSDIDEERNMRIHYDEDGNIIEAFDSGPTMSGNYSFDGGSIDFYKDYICEWHFDTPAFPATDEEGNLDGHYHVKDNLVYISRGGQPGVHVFEVTAGNKLIFQYNSQGPNIYYSH